MLREQFCPLVCKLCAIFVYFYLFFFQKSYRSFLMENLKVKQLETDNLKLLRNRLEAEERGASRLGKGNLVTEGVADSDEEDEIGTR